MKKLLIPLLFLFIFSSIVYAVVDNYDTIFNPFTGTFDYIAGDNYSFTCINLSGDYKCSWGSGGGSSGTNYWKIKYSELQPNVSNIHSIGNITNTSTERLDVDNGTLFVDPITNRVGVNTKNPSTDFEVNGNINVPYSTSILGKYYIGNKEMMAYYKESRNSVYIGGAGNVDITGDYNIGIGRYAMQRLTKGYHNFALGKGAMRKTTTSIYNVVIGNDAFSQRSGGSYNTVLGDSALYSNNGGSHNFALGYSSMAANDQGSYNIAVGEYSLGSSYNGSYNVGIGRETNYLNRYGNRNIMIGHRAGRGNSYHNKYNDTFIGYEVGYSNYENNTLLIGRDRYSNLIEGKFDTKKLKFYADVNITKSLVVNNSWCNSTNCYNLSDFLKDTTGGSGGSKSGKHPFLYNDSDYIIWNETHGNLKYKNSSFIQSIKVDNSSFSDDSNLLDGQDGSYYLDDTTIGNCSETGSCSPTVVYGNYNNTKNITITDGAFYFGQPLDGSIGSGIINSSSNTAKCGSVNVTDKGGLTVSYPSMIVRLVNLDGTTTHCYIQNNTITVNDNQHSVYYVDSDCSVKSTTWANFFNKNINPSNFARIFDVYATEGDIEVLKGGSLLGLKGRRLSWVNVNCGTTAHLGVCNGIDVVEDTFPVYNQTSGHYNYIDTVVTSKKRETDTDGVHFVYRSGGTWTHSDDNGINLTHCDDGTNLVPCSNNKYRRYFVGSIGWGITHTKIHQLAALDSEYFNNVGDCLNVEKYPLSDSYTMPDGREGVFLLHHVYCGQRDDTGWNGNWIDLRDGGIGAGGGIPDLSGYLRNDEDIVMPTYNATFDYVSANYFGSFGHWFNLTFMNTTWSKDTNTNCSEKGSCPNIAYQNTNVSFDRINASSYRNSTGGLKWIKPENIYDVDKENIESDLNTFVDIAGDTMTGNLYMSWKNISNVAYYNGFNLSYWNKTWSNDTDTTIGNCSITGSCKEIVYNNTNVTFDVITANNFSGKLNCLDIYGGSDNDFCTDATGSGGGSTSENITVVRINTSKSKSYIQYDDNGSLNFYGNSSSGSSSSDYSIELTNLDDAYVKDGNTGNYGGVSPIYVHYYSSYARISFLKFDKSEVGDNKVNSAYLNLTMIENYLDSDSEGWTISIYHLFNHTWKEDEITGQNYPNDYNSTPEDVLYIDGGDNPPIKYEVNVTKALQTEDGNNVSFIIKAVVWKGSPSSTDYVGFASKEDSTSSQRPSLVVSYSKSEKSGNCIQTSDLDGTSSIKICNNDYLYTKSPDDASWKCGVTNNGAWECSKNGESGYGTYWIDTGDTLVLDTSKTTNVIIDNILNVGSRMVVGSSSSSNHQYEVNDVSNSSIRMWFDKGSFRAGYDDGTKWDESNVGEYSFAVGDSPKASGDNSIAIGKNATASSTGAVAIGESALASGILVPIAIGKLARADDIYSTAIGYQANADNDRATAIGYRADGHSRDSLAIGYTTTAYTRATAIGYKTVATQNDATAVGKESTADGRYSVAVGYVDTTKGYYSTAVGSFSHAGNDSGDNGAVAIGYNAEALNPYSIAIGKYVKSTANNSIVIGSGYNLYNYLINNVGSSLLIGINNVKFAHFKSDKIDFYKDVNVTNNINVKNNLTVGKLITEPNSDIGTQLTTCSGMCSNCLGACNLLGAGCDFGIDFGNSNLVDCSTAPGINTYNCVCR